MVTIEKGLDGVVIDESQISMVDGEAGDIWYAGYHIDDLATKSTFPEVLFLLWNGELPEEEELDGLDDTLRHNRELPAGVERTIEELAPRARPMDILRTAVSMLAGYAEDPDDMEAGLRENLLDIVAAMPTIVAYTHHYREGRDPIEPRADLGHVANFLYMFHGEEPDLRRVRAVETALILYAEHGMNASTFSAVVTASTLANPYAAISSAIGTLHGPLHGGATETVVEMFQDIGDPGNVEDWVDDRMAAGENIPGFGHRVYRVTDPRCKHFRASIEELAPGGEVSAWFEIAEALRTAVEERLGEKGIWPNTDLYSGIFYRTLEIPPEYYTTIFALARVAGWSAHVVEQLADNRILRPRVAYVGETGREYVPLEER